MPVVDTAANVTVWFVLSPPFDTPTWRPVGTRSASGSTHMREELNCSSSGGPAWLKLWSCRYCAIAARSAVSRSAWAALSPVSREFPMENNPTKEEEATDDEPTARVRARAVPHRYLTSQRHRRPIV